MLFRLLTTGFKSAAANMAIDEAVLEHIANGETSPTLRLYGWSPNAISIGYFQSLEEEVDLQSCKTYGVDVVRRITGGGAVLHEHEITYSIHIPEKADLLPQGILESYGKICGGILKGLSKLGLSPQFVPLNDIVVMQNGMLRKISGNAQTRKKGIILQHGTVLIKVDIDKMFSLLKVPNEKLKGKLIEDVKQRVTSISDALGRDVTFDEMTNVLLGGFRKEFPSVEFENGELKESEKRLAEKLVKEKYGRDEWNRRR